MNVHGDKTIQRREGMENLNHYQEAREFLKEDFFDLCGYCGKNSGLMHERFHIDHFVPLRIDRARENDYYNLVWACPKCNLTKSGKWPTEDKNIPHDFKIGFIDPTTAEYNANVERDRQGYIIGKTELGCYMCEKLNFHIRRTDLYWKIQRLNEQQEYLEKLHSCGVLAEKEKDFYIQINILLKQYITTAFEKGE